MAPFSCPLRGGPKHSRTSGTSAFSDASKLSLTRAVKTREGEWSADEYDVLEGNRRVGRIVLTAQGPQGMPWLWEITEYAKSRLRRKLRASDAQIKSALLGKPSQILDI